jgi:argininosuccinate lyase
MGEPTQRKPWGGRFEKRTDPRVERFSSSVHFDRKLWRQDVRASLAHARMLVRQGILTQVEGEQLEEGLRKVEAELESGTLALDPSLEDIHMNVERRLAELLGEVAGKLHSGRSRNDQVATDFLLWMRDEVLELRDALLGLRTALIERAKREIDVVLPGYTHLQRAQPLRLAHYWLAHACALERDDARLRDARARMSRCPLGSGALAGSTLPLDPAGVAEELGFEGPALNSLDAVSSRDAALELLATLAVLGVHLSRLCEELVLWSSSEFAFVEFDDAFATGSSLMPQKKNPDVAELVRGKTGRLVGHLTSLLVTVKGLPLAYNRDLQEDKEPVFDAVETVKGCLEALTPTLETLHVRAEVMRQAASDPALLATDLAEYLVGRGVPFREAHEVVGSMVRRAHELGVPLDEMPREVRREIHPELELDVREVLSLERSLEARTGPGAPARPSVKRAIRDAEQALSATAAELEALGR